jgi:hypothetical protein
MAEDQYTVKFHKGRGAIGQFVASFATAREAERKREEMSAALPDKDVAMDHHFTVTRPKRAPSFSRDRASMNKKKGMNDRLGGRRRVS